MSLKVVRWLTWQPRALKGHGENRERRGGEGEGRLPITFYDLTSKVMKPHFLHALLVKAVTKIHPGSRRGPTSRRKKSESGMVFSGDIFGNDNLPHPP